MVFSGCFIWGPVKDGFQDFTAYFNTYYNGEHAFEDALKDVKTSLKEHDIDLISGQPSTLFTISPVARQGFDTAIEKASKVLQFYPTSGYTENCLFMIGIGYYYEGDNIRSGRKFIEEESKYPNSKRFSEAEMYYGEIEIRNRNYNDGYNDLMKSIATAEEERNWEIAAQTADDLSDYFLSQSDTTTAAVYLDSAAVFSKGDDASLYACESGSLFENIGNFEEAKLEYKAAWDYARDIRLRFYSRYFLARTERHEKQFYAALGDLRYLRKDDKFYQYFPLIDYQNAEALYDSGETSAAFLEFQRIDTAYATSEAATRSAFRVANIYLYKVGDYQNALKYYQKSSSHVPVPAITQRAQQQSASLQEYFISAYRLQLADSLYRRTLSAASRNDSTIKHSQEEIDTLYEHVAEAQQGLAGFYLFKLQIPDSAINHYLKIVSEFPKSSVYPSALYTLGEYYFSTGDTTNGKNYLTELISEHPESSFSLSANSLLGIKGRVFVDSTQVGYNRAMDFENRDDHDSALVVLKDLLNGPKSSLTQKVLYAIGWIYDNKLNLPDSAFVYYKKVSMQYPTSNYAVNIDPTVAGYEQAQRDSVEARKRAADSIAVALKQSELDSVKRTDAHSNRGQMIISPDSTKEKSGNTSPLQTQKPDSLDAIRQKAVSDSIAMHRR